MAESNAPVIGKASVLVSAFTVDPVNSNGESVYLYTIPNTTEGDTIYIDNDEFISSVVYHETGSVKQYLYLPKTAAVAKVKSGETDKYYKLTFNETKSIGVAAETVKIALNSDSSAIYPDLVSSGISVLTDSSGYLLGIVVDTTVYGGEGAAYLDSVGVVSDNVLYDITDYYYIDGSGNETTSSAKAFFPVVKTGSDSSDAEVRGAVCAGTEKEYYVSSSASSVIIKGTDSDNN
ncbi:MAG: hypothetical protein LUD77_00370 [Clostridiales bacterium]|nr:hypothetical protein [Clostridiales bacterium]